MSLLCCLHTRIFLLTALVASSSCQSSSSDPAASVPAPGETVEKILFDSNQGGNYEIYMAKADGSGVQQLTHDSSSDHWWPRANRTHDRILFYKAPAGHMEDYGQAQLWVMNADGTDSRAVIDDGNINSKPGWSSDGTRFFFHRMAPLTNPTFRLFSIGLDGAGLATVDPFSSGFSSYPTVL